MAEGYDPSDSFYDTSEIEIEPLLMSDRDQLTAADIYIEGSDSGRSPMANRTKNAIIGLVVVLVGLGLGLLIGYFAFSSSSSNADQSESFKLWEDALKGEDDSVATKLMDILKAENIRDNLKLLTNVPHLAGTPQDKFNAEYIRDQWTSQGLDSVQLIPHKVLLSYPDKTNPNLVHILNADGTENFTSAASEAILTPEENNTDVVPPFNAYAKNKIVEGDLVYVNYGRIEDFQYLERNRSINTTGKIVIARYGQIFRGDKVTHAQLYGAAGMILYSDPADYAISGVDQVYPHTVYLPGTGVQRGTLFLDNGDPLTPGYPSVDNAYREKEEDISSLPKIPVHPIGYDDAKEFLNAIEGESVPESWRGNIENVTYTFGPELKDNKKVKLEVYNYREQKYTYTTVGYIQGSLEPDRYVMLGNHRDAWVFGAVDPSSGTATLLEITRAFGQLLDSGWRPRRTLMFCSWGAEEYGLIGSNEWMEGNIKTLTSRAVAYLNVDIAVQGSHSFRASSTPNLYQMIMDVTKQIPDPKIDGKTIFDTWLERVPDNDDDSVPYIGNLGSGSDYAPFLDVVGISAIDMRYEFDRGLGLSSYPLYHSMYETFYLVDQLMDPGFLYHLGVSRVWSEVARRLADSLFLPLNCQDYATKMEKSMKQIQDANEEIMKGQGITFDAVNSAIQNFSQSAQQLHNYMDTLDSDRAELSPLTVRQVNDQLAYLERAFIDPLGLPGRPFVRHIVFAPSSKNSYFGDAFPGLVDALFDIENAENPEEQWEMVKKQMSIITFFIQASGETLASVVPSEN